MALIPIVTDGTETGATAATKINTCFSQTDINTTMISSIGDRVTANEISITSIDGRVTTNETDIADHETRITNLEGQQNRAVAVRGVNRPEQTLTANTPTLLEWMDSIVVNSGGTYIAANLAQNEINILQAGVYKISGSITFTAPNNNIITLELYKDNLPTGFRFVETGKGATQTVTAAWTALESFDINDELSIYVTSTGTSITITYGNFAVEKTIY